MPKEFLEKGGTELAPMSKTANLKIAMGYSKPNKTKNAVLLRLRTENFMARGPDISFLSAFPAEVEYLFPPLTFMSPLGDSAETLEIDDASYQVCDVKPVFTS